VKESVTRKLKYLSRGMQKFFQTYRLRSLESIVIQHQDVLAWLILARKETFLNPTSRAGQKMVDLTFKRQSLSTEITESQIICKVNSLDINLSNSRI
jgi:hypothetical protein